jgi:hypothetical protein
MRDKALVKEAVVVNSLSVRRGNGGCADCGKYACKGEVAPSPMDELISLIHIILDYTYAS